MVNKKIKQYWIIGAIIAVILVFLSNQSIKPDSREIIEIKANPKLSDSLKMSMINILSKESTPFAIAFAKIGTKSRVIIETKNNDIVIKKQNLRPIAKIDELNILVGEYTPPEIINLTKDENVIQIDEDILMEAYLSTSVDVIRAEPKGGYTQNTFGKGVKVCVLDTGINDKHQYIGELDDNHKALCLTPPCKVGSAIDGHGHGTHCAGIIMSSMKRAGGLNGGYEDGVAPDTELYVGKVLGDNGRGYFSGILDGIRWCIDDAGADIISMSLGGGNYPGNCDSTSMCQQINHLLQGKNTIIVVAAGNAGSQGGGAPGCCSSVVSVASTTKNKQMSYFSSYNDEVDISAVGSNVLSTFQPLNRFATLSGTSMATPHIAGALAVLKSVKPTTTKGQLLDAVYSTAVNLGYPKKQQGYGLIDVYGACNALMPPISPDKCANVQYSNSSMYIKSGKRGLEASMNSWIRLPFFEEKQVETKPATEVCPTLSKEECLIYSSNCAYYTKKGCISNSQSPQQMKYIKINPQNYYVYSANIKSKLVIDSNYRLITSAQFPGSSDRYAIYHNLPYDALYISYLSYNTEYYYVFRRLDYYTGTNIINKAKSIKEQLITSNYNILGFIGDESSTANVCKSLFSSKYSDAGRSCSWWLN